MFKRNGREVPAFANAIAEFEDVRLREGGWIGFEFESDQTDDLLLLLLSVVNVDPDV